METYINLSKAFAYIDNKKKIDSVELISDIDRQLVLNNLEKNMDSLPLPQPFICVNEPMEEENWSKLPPYDKKKILELKNLICKQKPMVIPALLKYREKYPNVPAIYNYLAAAYGNYGQEDKCYKICIETRKKFPNYLFGKTILGEYYLRRFEQNKIPEIFENKFEIYMHYPETIKKFHTTAVLSFYTVIGSYFARSENIKRALMSYFHIVDIFGKDHYGTIRLADEIAFGEINKLMNHINI